MLFSSLKKIYAVTYDMCGNIKNVCIKLNSHGSYYVVENELNKINLIHFPIR